MLKNFTLFIGLFLCSQLLFAGDDADSLKQRPALLVNHIDSLKKQLELTTGDSLKGPIYIRIASEYIQFDTVSNKKIRREYEEAAISYTMSALHNFSRYNDSLGLRTCFDHLAKIYHAQKKYPQAKWFILQSNDISRAFNDNPGIVESLLELASIKADIKDYTLAMRDLNEALTISSKKHYPQLESLVQLNYAMLYDHMKNYSKADLAMKRRAAIDDSVKKAEEAVMLAKQRTIDSLLAAQKKSYLISSKGPYTSNSLKRPAILLYSYLSSF